MSDQLIPCFPTVLEDLCWSYLWQGSRALLARAGYYILPIRALCDPTTGGAPDTFTNQQILLNLIEEGWTAGARAFDRLESKEDEKSSGLDWEAALVHAATHNNPEAMGLCGEKGALDWLAALLTAARWGHVAPMLLCAMRGTTSQSFTYYNDDGELQEGYTKCVKLRVRDWNHALVIAARGGHMPAIRVCQTHGANVWTEASQTTENPTIAKYCSAKAAQAKEAAHARAALPNKSCA